MPPLPPDDPPHSPTVEVKVCDICGDGGFEEMLAICSQCNDGAEHVYCMQTILDTMPSSNWVCEGCKLKECEDNREKRLTCADLEGQISKRPCLTRIEVTDGYAKMGSKKDSELISPSKKRPAENAADCCISKKHASEPTGNFAGNHTVSAKHGTAVLDLCKVNSGFLSEALQKGSSSPSAVAGGQPSNDTLSGRILKLPSGSTSGRLTDGQPVRELEPSLKTVEGESLIDAGFSINKQTPSPRHAIEKPCSSKFDHDLFSFLLPSRPKSLIRSSSAKLPSIGASFKTIKPSNLSNNMVKATEKINGQHFSAGRIMIDRPEDAKLKGFEKTVTMKSKLAVSKTFSVANTRVYQSLQGKQEDITSKTGLGNQMNDTIKANAKPFKCLEVNKLSPLEKFRCDRGKRMGHTSKACTALELNGVSEVTTSGRQREAKINDKTVGSAPLLQMQTNKQANVSQDEPFESTDKLQQSNQSKFLRNRSNLVACGNNPDNVANSQSLKQVSKPSFHNDKMQKQRFVAEDRKKWEAKVECTSPPPRLIPSFPFPHSDEGNVQPKVQGGPRLASSQFTQENMSALQIPLGMGMPFQSLHKTGLGTASQVPHHENLSPELCAIPVSQILWRGCFKVSSSTSNATFYSGMQAHPSNRANPKVWEAASALPNQLEVEELPRGVQNNSWPKSFQESPPTSNSIGIFIFPVNMTSHDACYKPLLDRMISCDLVLKVSLEFTQLLVFPSHLLPEAEQRWDGMKYLWGVFRANKGKVLQTTVIDSPTVVTTELMAPPDGHGLGSPTGVGDVRDIDITMKDGTDVIGAHASVDRVLPESETCDLLKDELHVEHDKCVDSIAPLSRHRQKGETLSQDPLSPSAELYRDPVRVGCKIPYHVPEHDMTLNTEASSTETSQVVGDALIKDMLKELSPVPNVMPMKFRNLTCSSHSELQESEEMKSATLIEGVFCQKQESRDLLMGKEIQIFPTTSLGGGECAKLACKPKMKIKHFTHTEKEDNNVMKLKRGNWNFNSKATDKKKTELDGNDDFKRNREQVSTKMQKCSSAELRMEPHSSHGSKHLCSSFMSNPGSSSCSLSGLPPCSPRKLELVENSMLLKTVLGVTAYHRQDSFPSSSGSVATENCQALSKLNMTSADNACNVQPKSERIPKTEIPLRLVDSGSSGLKDEHTTTSLQCQAATLEWIDTASQHFEPGLSGKCFPCLHLFQKESSSTEFNTTGIIGDIVVDQEGNGNDQRSGVTQPEPFIEQLERPLYRSLNSLVADAKPEPSRKPLPVQSVNGLPESDLKLALSIPHYRKEGNTWIRIEEDPFLCFDGQVDLSLSLP